MPNLAECLIDTKFRVFEVGDKIVHSREPGKHYTIDSFFVENGVKLMRFGMHVCCPEFWSKVQ